MLCCTPAGGLLWMVLLNFLSTTFYKDDRERGHGGGNRSRIDIVHSHENLLSLRSYIWNDAASMVETRENYSAHLSVESRIGKCVRVKHSASAAYFVFLSAMTRRRVRPVSASSPRIPPPPLPCHLSQPLFRDSVSLGSFRHSSYCCR